ncbi:MAG: hypothetical protein KGQ93_14020 [Cyanobacteria bacterium REEB459]|nr:hypothetical protein [Cyanobacteria bacterium REEB459]
MNNSTIRICTLASCGGLLTLTAWNHHKPQSLEVASSSTTDTGTSTIKPDAKVARVSSGSATRPELRLPLGLSQPVKAVSAEKSPSTSALVAVRLKQLRQERETLMQSRSVVVPAPPTRIQSLTVARLPQSLGRVDRSIEMPAVPAVGALRPRAAAPRVVAPKPALTSPQKPAPNQVPAAISISATPAEVLPPQAATSPASPQHQSYGLSQGTAPALTPSVQLPTGPDGFHSQELNSQARISGTKLISQVGASGDNMNSLISSEFLAPTQTGKTKILPLAVGGEGPALSGQTPGFSPATGILSPTPRQRQ